MDIRELEGGARVDVDPELDLCAEILFVGCSLNAGILAICEAPSDHAKRFEKIPKHSATITAYRKQGKGDFRAVSVTVEWNGAKQ
jgi:hypothetical protein